MGLPVNEISTGSKNLLINGLFEVYQRSVNASGQGGAYVSADRWGVDGLNYQNTLAKNISLAVNSTLVLPGTFSHGRISTVDALTNRVGVSQKIENIFLIPYVGRTMTLSFWVRRVAGASCTGDASISSILYPGDGVHSWSSLPRDAYDLTTVNFLNHNTAFNSISTTAWTQFTRSFTVTSTMGANGLQIGLFAACNGSNYRTSPGVGNSFTFTSGALFDLAGVSLTLSGSGPDIASIRKTYAEELTLCWRYYEPAQGMVGTAISTSQVEFGGRFAVAKRTIPSLLVTGIVSLRSPVGPADFSSSGALQNATASPYSYWTQMTGYSGLSATLIVYDRGTSTGLWASAEL